MDVKAYAKINLTLDVLRKRSDGYHDISSVMQTLSLHDDLKINVTDRDDGKNKIAITCSYPFLPCEETNLCYKACNAFLNEFDIFGKNIYITIEKRIPIAAGLGGGSSDGAETLKALDVLFGTNAGKEKLKALGATLGADVPFFIEGGCMLAEGIGERLSPAKPLSGVFVLLAKPFETILTDCVYRGFDALDPGLIPPLSTEGFLSSAIGERLGFISNMLAAVSEAKYLSITKLKKKMLSLGALAAEMTGSGPTVFGIFKGKKDAMTALDALSVCDEIDFLGICEPV